MKNVFFLLVALLLVTACATTQPAPTSTSLPPTETPQPRSCDVVDGICLDLTFDGESCIYDGPTDLQSGPVTLIFHNESDEWAETNMIRILGDKTLQDVILRVGEEPLEHDAAHVWRWFAAPWWFTIPGVDKRDLGPGESNFWEGVLEPGIHALFCVRHPAWPEQFGVWLGTGLTVGD